METSPIDTLFVCGNHPSQMTFLRHHRRFKGSKQHHQQLPCVRSRETPRLPPDRFGFAITLRAAIAGKSISIRQVVIALIFTYDGLPIAYEERCGITSDKVTLHDVLGKITAQFGNECRTWIMD